MKNRYKVKHTPWTGAYPWAIIDTSLPAHIDADRPARERIAATRKEAREVAKRLNGASNPPESEIPNFPPGEGSI